MKEVHESRKELLLQTRGQCESPRPLVVRMEYSLCSSTLVMPILLQNSATTSAPDCGEIQNAGISTEFKKKTVCACRQDARNKAYTEGVDLEGDLNSSRQLDGNIQRRLASLRGGGGRVRVKNELR